MSIQKNVWIKLISVLILATTLLTAIVLPASAIPSYKTGANGASPSYAGGKYYRHVMSIPLTGDGVTDVLAVALSQLGYSESANNNALSGVANGWGNHTEYNWNIGDIEGDGYEMEWCASFCSWALLQGGATTHNSFNDACRKHPNDPNYIWREVGCPPWVASLKNAGRYSLRGTYTPQSGDLIFFNRGNTVGHIGLVVWCDGTKVYTIEGNTSDGAGIEGNGGGVYYKSYYLTNTGINGYGRLPYVSKPEVPKVDYSGANKTAGLYITKSAFKVSPPVDAGHPVYEEVYTIPKYEMFEVKGFTTGIDNVRYAIVQHGSGTYYAKLNSNVLQLTASGSTQDVHVCSFHFTYTHETHMDRCDGCGAEKNYTPHVYVSAHDESEHFLQCSVCQYKKPRSYGAHSYDTYATDATSHVIACACGRPAPSATRAAHDFSIFVSEGRYACVCGAEQQNGSVHFHQYGFTYDATHHMDRCECGARINEVEHDFQPAHDEKEHFLQCSCGYKKPKSYGAHEFSYVIDGEEHVMACECGYEKPGTRAAHSHGFTYDATHHMDRCECDSRINVEAHNFLPAFDEKEHYLQCRCGYKKPRSYSAHAYTSFVATETGHTRACECGQPDPTASQVPHSFTIPVSEGVYACECGATQQNGSTVHAHQYHFTYTHETHMYRCDACGSEKNYVPHDYKTVFDENQHYLQCWCGYKKPGSYGSHEYNTYVTDEDRHVRACACGCPDPTATPAEHTYDTPVAGDQSHHYACKCGAEDASTTQVHQCTYQSEGDTTHKCVCETCGATKSTAHVFDRDGNTKCICGHAAVPPTANSNGSANGESNTQNAELNVNVNTLKGDTAVGKFFLGAGIVFAAALALFAALWLKKRKGCKAAKEEEIEIDGEIEIDEEIESDDE